MPHTITKTVVIGAGVMGSKIAALLANAGVPVVLMDIVPPGAENRNILAEQALQKMLDNLRSSPLTYKSNAELITCANIEDDIHLIEDADWVIEAVTEKLHIKQEVYRKIDKARQPGCIVSSNTSTIPLSELIEGLPEDLQRHMFITHFFNPPRKMRLLELVAEEGSNQEAYECLRTFCDITLGKTIVPAKDTPGFIANRIGIYWMMAGLSEALHWDVGVEEADSIMSKPVGIPKTGIFGLFDLVGIDVMMDIAASMVKRLPEGDSFHQVYAKCQPLLEKMVSNGYTGNKGKGGFYLTHERKVCDLKAQQYRDIQEPKLESISKANNAQELVRYQDVGGQYARTVLAKVLSYTASLLPGIADDIVTVDTAMRTGFNWQYGPFQLIDMLGNKEQSGAQWLQQTLGESREKIPALLDSVGAGPFYTMSNGQFCYLTLQGTYAPVTLPEDKWTLHYKTAGKTPIRSNPSARLWDIGDHIALLEFTTKGNTFDMYVFDLICEVLQKKADHFNGLVIGTDTDDFSFGLNLNLVLDAAEQSDWKQVSHLIRRGQQTMMAVKYSPVPVVPALCGRALGGATELMLHSAAVQAHMESYAGLVETKIGLIPSWGGTKEMLFRHVGKSITPGGEITAIAETFSLIAQAKTSGSAQEAQDMLIVNGLSRISMNRDRLLADAKALCLSLVDNYQPSVPHLVSIPKGASHAALTKEIDNQVEAGKLDKHAEKVQRLLARVLSGGSTDVPEVADMQLASVLDRGKLQTTEEVTEQQILDLEHDAFMELVQTHETLELIGKVLGRTILRSRAARRSAA